MIGEALVKLLTGPTVDPAQQQLQLAAQQLNNSGVYLLRQKNYSGAINEFEQALAKTPNDSDISNNLALAKQMLGQSRKNAVAAAQTSNALGKLLSVGPSGWEPPAGMTHSGIPSPNNSALNSINLDAIPARVTPAGPSTQPETSKTLHSLDDSLNSGQDADLKRQLDWFAKDYLPKHPELNNSQPADTTAAGAAHSGKASDVNEELKKQLDEFNYLYLPKPSPPPANSSAEPHN